MVYDDEWKFVQLKLITCMCNRADSDILIDFILNYETTFSETNGLLYQLQVYNLILWCRIEGSRDGVFETIRDELK